MREKRPLLYSVFFHGTLLGCLTVAFTFGQKLPAKIPFGITMEFEDPTPAPRPRRAPRQKKPEVHQHDAYDLITHNSHLVAEQHEEPEIAENSEGPIGVSDGAIVSAWERYLFELRTFIEQHKRYPAAARMMGQTGSVEISFQLSPDGSISDVRVKNPCPHDHLNDAAVDLVAGLKRFQPIPEVLGQKAPLQLSIPITYKLN